jgi:hypothetical protein
MNMAAQVNDLLAQMSGKAVETLTLWADVHQKLLRELVDLSASTAKEGVRLHAELQSAALEAARDGRAFWLQRRSSMQEAPKDPLGSCQQTVVESLESAQKAFKLLEGSAQAVTQSAGRLQATAEQTGREIQASFAHLGGKLNQLYTPTA